MTEGELYLRRLRGMIQMIEPSLDDEKIDEYLAMWWSDAIDDLEELGGETDPLVKNEAWRTLARINSERVRKVVE